MPEVLSTSPFAPESLKRAIAAQLEDAPPDALQVTAVYQKDGEARADVVVKLDKGPWVLTGGGFVEKDAEGVDYGVAGSLTLRF